MAKNNKENTKQNKIEGKEAIAALYDAMNENGAGFESGIILKMQKQIDQLVIEVDLLKDLLSKVIDNNSNKNDNILKG